MKTLQPVAWTKGDLLTPQHLQAQEWYFESVLRFHLDGLRASYWGFTELALDNSQLERGVFTIRRAAGLLPDGVSFDIPDSDTVPARPLQTCFSEGEAAVELMLAVPLHRSSRANLAPGDGKAGVRYAANTREVPDENTGGREKPVQFLRKNMSLLTVREAQEGYIGIPIARVIRNGPTQHTFDKEFIPPVLQVHASARLANMGAQLTELVLARSDDLASMRKQRNSSLAQFSSTDVARFWLLYTVNSSYAALRHAMIGTAHPEDLFAEMLSLAGALTAFSPDTRVSDLPIYNHDNLTECFSRLNTQVRHLLATVIRSNAVSLTLKLLQPFVYATALDVSKHIPVGVNVFLGVRSSAPTQQIIADGPQTIKVGSISQIEELYQRSTYGVPLSNAETPEAIPVKTAFHYFHLNTAGDKWEAIRNAGNIAVYVPGDFPDPVLELILLLPDEA